MDKIIEGNKVVAEFDGWRRYEPNERYRLPHYERAKNEWRYEHDLKYHSSWDWFHPAWSKVYRELRLLNDSTAHKLFEQMRNALINSDITVAFEVLCRSIAHLKSNGTINNQSHDTE